MRTLAQELETPGQFPYDLLLEVMSCPRHLAFPGKFSYLQRKMIHSLEIVYQHEVMTTFHWKMLHHTEMEVLPNCVP